MTTRAEMAGTIGALLDGTLAGDDALWFLQHQDMAEITPEMLAGAVDAVMARANPFPVLADAIDCCGTGGDGLSTYNISTAAALVVAAAGVPVAKHGNKAVSSASGSADVLAALGVNTNITTEQAARVFAETKITFLFAPQFHPGFARIAPLRKAIGKRTIFNVLGPLSNPARVNRQLIGVFAPHYCPLIAETEKLLGRTQVMVVHGEDGTDELSITGATHASILRDGTITQTTFHPRDGGLEISAGRALVGGDAAHNARALRDVLTGEQSPYADAVMLNAAAALMVANAAPDLRDGVAMARAAIASGAATRTLDHLVTASNHV